MTGIRIEDHIEPRGLGLVEAYRLALRFAAGRKLGILALTLLGLASSTLVYGDALIIAALVDNLAGGGSLRQHAMLVGVLLGVFLLQRFFNVVEAAYSFQLQTALELDMRNRFFRAALARPEQERQGDRGAGRVAHVERSALGGLQEHVTDLFSQLVRNLALLVVALVLVVQFSVPLALGFIGLAALWAVISYVFFPRLQRHLAHMHSTAGSSQHLFVDAVAAAPLLRRLGAEDAVAARYQRRQLREAAVAGRFQRFSILQRGITASPLVVLFFMTYAYGGNLVLEGRLSVGELLAFSMIASRAIGPLNGVVDYVFSLARLKINAARVAAFRPFDSFGGRDDRHRVPPLAASLRVDGLCLQRDGRTLLRGLDFTVAGGELLVIQGASGVGKSTLAAVLAGELPPAQGRLELVEGDGRLRLVRAADPAIAVVEATPRFLSGTVRDNLVLGLREHPSDAVLADLLSAVHLGEVIPPTALDQPLEADGAPYSHGQAQRLALARALLRQPAVLILDEALAGVEPATERAIIAGLRARQPGLTIICMTHRDSLNTLASARLDLQAYGPEGGGVC